MDQSELSLDRELEAMLGMPVFEQPPQFVDISADAELSEISSDSSDDELSLDGLPPGIQIESRRCDDLSDDDCSDFDQDDEDDSDNEASKQKHERDPALDFWPSGSGVSSMDVQSRPTSPIPSSTTPGYLSPSSMHQPYVEQEAAQRGNPWPFSNPKSEATPRVREDHNRLGRKMRPNSDIPDEIPVEYFPSMAELEERIRNHAISEQIEEEIDNALDEGKWPDMVTDVALRLMEELDYKAMGRHDFQAEVYRQVKKEAKKQAKKSFKKLTKVIGKKYAEVVNKIAGEAALDNYLERSHAPEHGEEIELSDTDTDEKAKDVNRDDSDDDDDSDEPDDRDEPHCSTH